MTKTLTMELAARLFRKTTACASAWLRAASGDVLTAIACMLIVAAQARAQSQLLDDFESLAAWHPITSEGAKLSLSTAEGKSGHAMAMDFDLQGVYGYVIAERNVAIDLPSNYQFTFDMKADIPVNNFEFKLMDEQDNVYWIKKINIEYPKQWERETIKKRQITFAWGPSGGGEIRHVSKLQIVVSTGQGGRGRVLIDNLRFEALEDPQSVKAKGTFSSSPANPGWTIDDKGTVLTHWTSARNDSAWIELSYNYLREIGGIAIVWDQAHYADRYTVEVSDDGHEWTNVYTVAHGNGGRDYCYLPEKDGRHLRLRFLHSHDGTGYAIARLDVKGAEFSLQSNAFYTAIAHDAVRGCFPKYFMNEQSYWTVSGVNADVKEALINEEGMIEVDKEAFSLEPFLYINGKLITWNDVTRTQSLEDDYLPIPSVTWQGSGWTLTVRLLSAGTAGHSMAIASYRLENTSGEAAGKLFIAIRPFMVNPPWQWLNSLGGVSHIKSIRTRDGAIDVDARVVIPMTKPVKIGATDFDGGDISEYLLKGTVPEHDSASDHLGFASAAIEYSFSVPSGSSAEYHVAVPFHGWEGSPEPNMSDGGSLYTHMAFEATKQFWHRELDEVGITLPGSAQTVVNTVKSNLAYILINRDGPGIQPGSRNYERSWIRDGSLTSTALLQLGIRPEVREYLDWYAAFQYPDGKIPCVVDARGADPTVENDSHGEFIYALKTYFNYTHDTTWLRGKFDRVVKTVDYIRSQTALEKTERFRTGTPQERSFFGLMPESISHEGYSDHPRHSYWDDFFTLKGLKDAAAIAHVLKERAREREFAAARDEFRKDLYASMRLAMKNKKIDYIPGCAELGDFDATSTTIGISPCNELGSIPEPQLHNTFDKYYRYFTERRMDSVAWVNYTPYENRVIGSFVYLNERDRAQEAMEYFLKDRRPAAWNQWAEVVWRDRAAPKFIGDMPHTWVGSDFIRSVRAMFVYERESDSSLVLGAGIPESWVSETPGVSVNTLPTFYGPISFTMKRDAGAVAVHCSGTLKLPHAGRIIVTSPMKRPVRSATINGRPATLSRSHDSVALPAASLPADIILRY